MIETETLELKRSTGQLTSSLKSVSAILNKHQKGELYFGIDEKEGVVGQDVSEKTIRTVSNELTQQIEPKIYPIIEKFVIEGKDCIKVSFSGNNLPYLAYGKAYIRVGDEDKQMSSLEIARLVLQHSKEKLHWDKEICKEATLDDINLDRFKWFLAESGLAFDNLSDDLKKLKLLEDGKLRNTAVILFGKEPERFFPNAKLRCAVFGTNDTSVTLDMKDYEADLFELIEKAENYILEHINMGMKLEGMKRINVPEINKEAFREAIINAFCHRDYYKYDSVNVAIFKDRVEIRSPGSLYGGLTIEEIKIKTISIRRNELLAEMFHKVQFVERWGRGIKLILTKEPTAEFEEYAGLFITTFMRKGGKISPPITPPEAKILDLIKLDNKITKKEIGVRLGLSADGVRYHIRNLRKKGLLEWKGSSKKGEWVVE
ncbi:MAG: putative DNA binding domain-containing protein [Nanoarchaeota archaeon]|nr:putative DNA binding domain-containing protein [Nanoarchaeota archaeon]MBU1623159.1 putative DNA binding domain-containing protein [Nanoarchaeota archaeon]